MTAVGTLFIISAPSGAGKSSLIDALLKRFNLDDSLRLSISHTTRDMRPGDADGVTYHFVSKEEFEALIARGAFFEYAQVFDHYYGTSRENAEKWINEGKDVLLDIDWQGARKIRAQVNNVCSIFILPPSLKELERRLNSRGRDSAEVIADRMHKAQREISHYQEYDYVIVNDDFDTALLQLRAIILSKRVELAKQQQRQASLLADLTAGYVPEDA
ncbi:MAG: guanylate kinase [Candidatus Anaerobiospirillum merdipullorum]|uniref:Guanylate kinase n=1 Tax=Candidatus Anaerobiospirillum merdipullorum TaxID=2838450 RepID=A0A9E2KQW8_9GAMM|nr:guanylate kinase [Candidatus Anaerobiospirillum merdipullorum]